MKLGLFFTSPECIDKVNRRSTNYSIMNYFQLWHKSLCLVLTHTTTHVDMLKVLVEIATRPTQFTKNLTINWNDIELNLLHRFSSIRGN